MTDQYYPTYGEGDDERDAQPDAAKMTGATWAASDEIDLSETEREAFARGEGLADGWFAGLHGDPAISNTKHPALKSAPLRDSYVDGLAEGHAKGTALRARLHPERMFTDQEDRDR